MTACGALLGAGHAALAPLDGRLFDLAVMANADPAAALSGRVAVVAIDAGSLAAPELVGIPRPLFQPVLAELIEALARSGAAAIGLDLLVAHSGNRLIAGYDTPLLQALSRHRAILALGRSAGTLPAPAVLAALRLDPAALGLLELTPDGDGVVRRLRAAVVPAEGAPLATLAAATLARAGSAMPAELLLAPQRHPADLPAYALIDVLRQAHDDPAALRRAFAGRVVFVGTTLAEEDRKVSAARFLTPAAPARPTDGLHPLGPDAAGGATLPGVLLHAQAAELVLAAWVPRAVPAGVPAVVAGLAGFGGAALGMLAPPLLAIAGVLALVLGAAAAAVVLLGHLMWLPPAAAMLAAAGGLAIAYPVRYAAERARRRWVQDAFGHYLSPVQVARLAADPSLLRLGGTRRDITVLFCDLRGFTALSERLAGEPERLVALVNRLMTALTDPVLAHGGTVDKYAGDSVMAFWNAPLDDPDHAGHAVAAACAMVTALAGLNRQLADEGGDPVELVVGIGIHSGSAVVGNMGSAHRFDYTAIGDAVNLASRLEGQCRVHDVAIIVSAATRARVPGLAVRPLGRVVVKGRTEPVAIYAVQPAEMTP